MRTGTILSVAACIGALAGMTGCGLPGGPGAFDRPAKAAKMSASLVRYYDECIVPGDHVSGILQPACNVSAPSVYNFGPAGSCTIKAQGVQQNPCDTGSMVTCKDVKIQVKCNDIRQADSDPVISAEDNGFNLEVVYRATMADINGDATMPNWLVTIPLTVDDGKLTLKDTPVNAAISTSFGAPAAAYLAPLNVEILSAQIIDPSSQPFATLGFAAN